MNSNRTTIVNTSDTIYVDDKPVTPLEFEMYRELYNLEQISTGYYKKKSIKIVHSMPVEGV